MAECDSYLIRTYTLTLSGAEAYYLKCRLQNPPQLNDESENDRAYREEIFRAIHESEVD